MSIELNLSIVGMGIIVISWIIQIVYTLLRDKKMNLFFAVLQAGGIALLVVDNYMANSAMTMIGALNMASAAGGFIMAGLILAKK